MSEEKYVNDQHKAYAEQAKDLTDSIAKREKALPTASTKTRGKGYDTEKEALEKTLVKERAALKELTEAIEALKKAKGKIA